MSDIELSVYDFSPGLHITKACELLLAKAKETGRTAKGVFNDRLFHAEPDGTAEQAYLDWKGIER